MYIQICLTAELESQLVTQVVSESSSNSDTKTGPAAFPSRNAKVQEEDEFPSNVCQVKDTKPV